MSSMDTFMADKYELHACGCVFSRRRAFHAEQSDKIKQLESDLAATRQQLAEYQGFEKFEDVVHAHRQHEKQRQQNAALTGALEVAGEALKAMSLSGRSAIRTRCSETIAKIAELRREK